MALAYGMHHSPVTQKLAHFILRLIGWRTHVLRQRSSSYVLIGAPHTSNWDFGLMLLLIAAEQLPIRFMGKDSLFRGPLGPLMRSLGGIPVNRRARTNLVDQIAAKFEEYDNLIIGLAPEGTRSKTSHWKTGFYYIALKAKVPVAMAYLDYGNRIIGVGPSFIPSGDIHADFEIIREFYSGIIGKNPDKQGEIVLGER
jgi:1-acyl-sn-glycerol-3-phosphate acyltransferase